ncbi:MAG: T9SS type A sorting domain-containing protein [Candidatus Zixiibacteriota bacterium]|nr:MAG: T9SS type A sorting domain-containing protein [candidate division Zixibacteria bacterium]
MKTKLMAIVLSLMALLALGSFNAATAGVMETIDGHLEFRLWGYSAVLLPGSSDDPDDAIAVVQFQMRFINGAAPPGSVTLIETNFTYDAAKWEFVEPPEAGPAWSGGTVECYDGNDCEQGHVALRLTGTTKTPSTSWGTFAYISFQPKCQAAGEVGNETYLEFDEESDNGCLVVDGEDSDWYNADPMGDCFIMVSAYISSFYIDYYDDAEEFMGEEVDVPVYFRQHILPHRLHTVTHKIDFDGNKLEYVSVTVNGAAYQSGTGTADIQGTDPVIITVEDASGGYIKQAPSTSSYVKLYDIKFKVKGHSSGPGSSVTVEFVDADCDHTAWTQWNEGGGDGCEALDNTVNHVFFDGDVDIPAYTAAMEIKPAGGDYSKGSGTTEFYVCLQNSFPVDKDASGGNGEINTLHDMPEFISFNALTDLNNLDFSGGSCVNDVRIFHAELQEGEIQSTGECTNMYKVKFNFTDNDYTPDWNDRTVEIPWLASASCGGNDYETSITDQTGYATLDYNDLDLSSTALNVHTGLFTTPYSTDEDKTVSQPLYIKSTFNVGEFSVNVRCDEDARITGVTCEEDVEYETVGIREVRIYYDGASQFCLATGDGDPVQVATVHYRVICGTAKTSGNLPGGTWYVTSTIFLEDAEMQMYGSSYQFVDTDPHSIRGKCFDIKIPRTDEIQSNAGLPTEFVLHPNKPNPFNPTTYIAYDVPKASHVRIDIINILGRKITTLVNEEKTPGRYETVWHATDESGIKVASGIYLYRMQAGDFIQTKKMMLMK